MSLLNIITSQLIDVIEWTDDSRDTLSYRWPDEDKEIKNGAQLIVRESQLVQFVAAGQYADLFGPGKHTLTTENIPILSTILGWKYGFQSPFKCDVYYLNTRLFTGNKWGTANPVMMRDKDFGVVRLRAFGTYDFRIVEAPKFLREVAGTDQNFRLDEFADTMRSRIVSVFTEALARAGVPVLDVAQRYAELGEALLLIINPAMREKYGLEDHQLHPRERFGAAGGGTGYRQALEHERDRQPERLRQVPDGRGDGAGRRSGFGGNRAGADGDGLRHGAGDDAQHAAARTRFVGGARLIRRRCSSLRCKHSCRRSRGGNGRIEVLTPEQAAQVLGVGRWQDVMAAITAGELKARKIGSAHRIARSALEEFLRG